MRNIQRVGIHAILVTAIAHGGYTELNAETSVTAIEHKRRTVYHSPQSPGFTCWTGVWAMPENSLMLAFTQATGPLKGRSKAPPMRMGRLINQSNWTRFGYKSLPKSERGRRHSVLQLSAVYHFGGRLQNVPVIPVTPSAF